MKPKKICINDTNGNSKKTQVQKKIIARNAENNMFSEINDLKLL